VLSASAGLGSVWEEGALASLEKISEDLDRFYSLWVESESEKRKSDPLFGSNTMNVSYVANNASHGYREPAGFGPTYQRGSR